MLRAALTTFVIGVLLLAALAIWRANDPSDDIFPECEYGMTQGEPC